MDINSIFDGIGTEIISTVVALIVGAIGGYKVGVRKNIKQNQSADGYSEQKQYGLIEKDNTKNDSKMVKKIKINQKQKAGEQSKQIQVGSEHK